MISTGRLLSHLDRVPELLETRHHTPTFASLITRYLEVGSPTYPFQVPLKKGGSMTLMSLGEVKVFWHVFVRNCYRLPKDCRFIVDAGANVGIFAVWAAKRCPGCQIVSLEPCTQTCALLEKNIRSTGLSDRVQVLQLGLAAQSGEREFRMEGPSPNRGLVLTSSPDQPASSHVAKIQCTTLAEFAEQHCPRTVDFLKMDIEGSEWEVLLSSDRATLRRFRLMQVEYHEVNATLGYSPEKLIRHMESAGHHLIHREEDAEHTGMAVFQLDASIAAPQQAQC